MLRTSSGAKVQRPSLVFLPNTSASRRGQSVGLSTITLPSISPVSPGRSRQASLTIRAQCPCPRAAS
eukprot:4551608-Pyramimonas_sp.AAC.1